MSFPITVKRYGRVYRGTFDLDKGYTLCIDGASVTCQTMRAFDRWLTLTGCSEESGYTAARKDARGVHHADA